MAREGLKRVAFAVHVPHYLTQNPFPAAAEELVTHLSRAAGLLLPTDELRAAAEVVRAEIDKQVAEAEQVSSLVRMLEQQYDAYLRGREGDNLLAGELPTADELGAELERFLAEHNKPGETPGA